MVVSETTADALTVTPQEVTDANGYIRSVADRMEAMVDGLTEAQLEFKPTPECWSIRELVEHTAIVQDVVLGPVLEGLASGERPAAGRDSKRIDAMIREEFPVRRDRFPSPERSHPTGKALVAESLQRIDRNVARFGEVLASRGDLRQHVLFSPPLNALTKGEFAEMDGYQWILAAAAHMDRHSNQILEWKANSAYPKA